MTVEIQDAEHRLAELAGTAALGEDVILLDNGKPLARLAPLVEEGPKRKFGFLDGKYTIPEDFDTMFDQQIEEMFYGHPEKE
jgi:antitoxin (DNA-binding transcriptional repressor) of toxin-antitoxin stability system